MWFELRRAVDGYKCALGHCEHSRGCEICRARQQERNPSLAATSSRAFQPGGDNGQGRARGIPTLTISGFAGYRPAGLGQKKEPDPRWVGLSRFMTWIYVSSVLAANICSTLRRSLVMPCSWL